MNSQEVQRALRETTGVRVGPHTADYVVNQLITPDAPNGFFVMGGDARTGRPVRHRITPDMLTARTPDGKRQP